MGATNGVTPNGWRAGVPDSTPPGSLARTGWFVTGDGLRLFWRNWLPAEEPAGIVMVLHGMCEHGGRYPHAVRALIDAGYVVYAHDARGHGRSQGRPGTVESFERLQTDLHVFLDQVVRPSYRLPTFLLGYSLGGATAVDYALRHDGVAGVVVVGSALGRGSGISRIQTLASNVLSATVPRLRLIRLRPEDMMTDPDEIRRYESDPLIHQGRVDTRFVSEMLRAIRDLPTEVHRLRAPLLLIHGADDVTADPRGSQNLHDKAGSADKTLVIYPDRRHDVLNEPGHEQVTADVVEWIAARG